MSIRLLTVIIPILNPERYITNLRRILSQQGIDEVRLILIHDRRSDDLSTTLIELKEEFSELDLTILVGSYGSAGMARNAALDICSSEWVAFCDADDFLDISGVLNILHNPMRCEVIVCQFIRVNAFGKVFEPSRSDKLDQIYLDPGFWRIIYRYSSLTDIHFSDLKMGEDIVFLADLFRMNPTVHFENQVIYQYTTQSPLQSTSVSLNYLDLAAAIELIKLHNPNWQTCDSDLGFIARLAISRIKYDQLDGWCSQLPTLMRFLVRNPTLIKRLITEIFVRNFAK